jgi:hypothetical protein
MPRGMRVMDRARPRLELVKSDTPKALEPLVVIITQASQGRTGRVDQGNNDYLQLTISW